MLWGTISTGTLKNITKKLFTENVLRQMTLRGTAEKQTFSKFPKIMQAILSAASAINKSLNLCEMEKFLKFFLEILN